ncbi:hypothetical protein [Agarivorans sp. 3_MG-2023]|uniref:hypothetical protein n=2 Tax=unclassified Agarivorans TaxID=2636026 RepID=UPI0026E15060|nr:hypothetical protein [Agarivorans sp. 3_MG-2023]MDO6713648.1 hypothetical protein [Agarivorans sp. 2_MG-2023]
MQRPNKNLLLSTLRETVMKKLFVVTTATAALIASAANAYSHNTFEANGNAFVAGSMEASSKYKYESIYGSADYQQYRWQ